MHTTPKNNNTSQQEVASQHDTCTYTRAEHTTLTSTHKAKSTARTAAEDKTYTGTWQLCDSPSAPWCLAFSTHAQNSCAWSSQLSPFAPASSASRSSEKMRQSWVE